MTSTTTQFSTRKLAQIRSEIDAQAKNISLENAISLAADELEEQGIDRPTAIRLLTDDYSGRLPHKRTARIIDSLLRGDIWTGEECYHHLGATNTAAQRLASKRIAYAVNTVLWQQATDGTLERRIVRVDGTWWRRSESGCWVRLDKGAEDVRSYIADAYRDSPPFTEKLANGKSITSEYGTLPPQSMLNETLNAVEEHARPPALREGRVANADRWRPFAMTSGQKIKDAVPFSDKCAWIDGGEVIASPHDPDSFFQVGRDYKWAAEDDTHTPIFDGFLADCANHDPDLTHLLLIMLGSVIAGDNRHERVWMLIGPKRTGKTRMVMLVEELAGIGATTEANIMELGDKFDAPGLMPHSLILFDEVGERPSGGADLTKWKRGLSFLKKLVGSDRLEGRNMWTVSKEVFRVHANVLMTSNDPPRMAGDLVGDAGAWEDRIIPIPFVNKRAEGERITDIADQIIDQELPAVARKCLEYWAASTERAKGVFDLPAASLRLKAQIAGSDYAAALDALTPDKDSILWSQEVQALAAIALGVDYGDVRQSDHRALRKAILTEFDGIADPEKWDKNPYTNRKAKGIGGLMIWEEHVLEAVAEMLADNAKAGKQGTL